MTGGGQFPLDVLNGVVLFAQGDDQFADPIACGGVLGSGAWRLKEAGAEGGVMPELVTEAAESGAGVAEAPGHVGGGAVVQEVSAEGLVLALADGFGGQEELGRLGIR